MPETDFGRGSCKFPLICHVRPPLRPQAGQDGGENQPAHDRYVLLRPELLDHRRLSCDVPEIMSDRDGAQREERERARAEPREAPAEHHQCRAGELDGNSGCRKEPWWIEPEVRHFSLSAGKVNQLRETTPPE